MNRVHFMSTHDNWSTPKDVYRTIDAEFGFGYDPCPLADVVKQIGNAVPPKIAEALAGGI